jgi:hypothetical protein
MADSQDPTNTGNKGTGDFTNDANDVNDIPDRSVAREPLATPRSLGEVLEERRDDLLNPLGRQLDDDEEAGVRGRNADRHDMPDPVDPTGAEWENGPGVDVDDPNLSQVMAEAGAEERREDLGELDETTGRDRLRLDDPEGLDDPDVNAEGENEVRGGGEGL